MIHSYTDLADAMGGAHWAGNNADTQRNTYSRDSRSGRGPRLAQLIVSLLLLLTTGSTFAGKLLEPMDTSSPRATMQSFLNLTEQITDQYYEFRESPSPVTQRALGQTKIKMARIFDLSEVAPANRYQVAEQTFYLLWEVVARQHLPDIADIPGSSSEQSAAGESEPLLRWRIPGTEIVIAHVTEGPYVGEYRFSPETVAHILDFYEMTLDLPYVQSMPVDNVYQIYELSTGWMIPKTWVESLPEWTNTRVFGQVLWKWFAMLLLIGLDLFIVIAVYRWGRKKAFAGTFGSYLRYLSAPLTLLLLTALVHYIAREQIQETGLVSNLSQVTGYLFYGVTLVWIVWLSSNQVAEAIIASPKVQAGSLDASLLRLISRAVGIVAVLVLVFNVLNQLGVPVAGLITGAGVGGIAIALASKNTLENFMGALNLFADRPVRVGDLCRFDDESIQGWRPVGRVESIGLRSTRIRRIDRFLITIPNAEFSQRNIVNLSQNDRFLLKTVLRLRYETTDDQMRFVLAMLRELLHAHPKTIHTAREPIRIRFVEFGDSSLNIDVRVYIRTTSYSEYLAIREDILLRVMKTVKDAGTGFAFPSSTVYLGRDSGLDVARQQAAEKQVREWASAQIMPFPDFTEAYRKQVTDTLDYPPEGSPGADRG